MIMIHDHLIMKELLLVRDYCLALRKRYSEAIVCREVMPPLFHCARSCDTAYHGFIRR